MVIGNIMTDRLGNTIKEEHLKNINMKEIRTEIPTTKVILKYQANDGTEFESKEECEKYESSAEGVLKARLKELIVGRYNSWELLAGNDDDEVLAVKFRNPKDVDTVLHLIYLQHPYLLKDEGKNLRDSYTETFNKVYEEDDIMLLGLNYDKDIYVIKPLSVVLTNLLNIKEVTKAKSEES